MTALTMVSSIINYIKLHPSFKLVIDPMQGTTVKYLEAIYWLIEKEVGRPFLEFIHTDNRDPEFTQVNGAPNPTEPDSTSELVHLVSKDLSTLGLATDGDGDRFGVIDFGGTEVSGNEVIALLTYFLVQKKLMGTKVYSWLPAAVIWPACTTAGLPQPGFWCSSADLSPITVIYPRKVRSGLR